MFLGYYKQMVKEFFQQLLLQYKLRKKGQRINKGCIINADTTFLGRCKIKNNVIIGPSVKLGNNIVLGSGSKINNICIGENCHIEGGVICTGYGNGKISIGKECYVGINNILDWSDNITIGDFVQIAGPSTALWTHSGASMCMNGIKLKNKSKKYRPTDPITIESYVYIGGNCTIYPGIRIGNHSIIAPNSAVTKNVEPYTMVGGVPATFIKKIHP